MTATAPSPVRNHGKATGWPRLLVALALAQALVSPVLADGPTGSRTQVTTSAKDASMTLVLPRARRGYPRNALTPIIIHLRNRNRYIEGFRIRCRRDDPRVQALNLRGTVRYPAGVPLLAPPTCPAAQIAPTLEPYGSYQRQFLAILGGPLLRGVWDYSTRSSLHRVLTGGILRVKLFGGQRPRVGVLTQPIVEIRVQPAAGSHGPLMYADAAECPGPRPGSPMYLQSDSGTFAWQMAQGGTITPPCSQPLRWLVTTGYVDQPVVKVAYSAG